MIKLNNKIILIVRVILGTKISKIALREKRSYYYYYYLFKWTNKLVWMTIMRYIIDFEMHSCILEQIF